MACKATWQRHADPRNAYVVRYIYIYSLFIITISIKGLQPSLYGKGSAFNILRVGLSSTEFLFYASDVARWRALDRAERSIGAHRSNIHVDHRIRSGARA